VGVVEAVAKKRGCLRQGRGGELDLEKAANILLTDFRSGALGRISLETPGTRAAMLEASRASLRGTQPNQEIPI
jgi:ribosome biogenesis GTPase A